MAKYKDRTPTFVNNKHEFVFPGVRSVNYRGKYSKESCKYFENLGGIIVE